MKLNVFAAEHKNSQISFCTGGIILVLKNTEIALAEPLRVTIDAEGIANDYPRTAKWHVYKDKSLLPASTVDWQTFSMLSQDEVQAAIQRLVGNKRLRLSEREHFALEYKEFKIVGGKLCQSIKLWMIYELSIVLSKQSRILR